jgi:hypothetical protein
MWEMMAGKRSGPVRQESLVRKSVVTLFAFCKLKIFPRCNYSFPLRKRFSRFFCFQLSCSEHLTLAACFSSDAFPVFGMEIAPSVVADDDTETNPVSLENVARRREDFSACGK